jgi:hypothetical protein
MSGRNYHFVLPYTISGIQDSVGISDLKDDGLWDQIPADLQAKLEAGDSWFSSGVEVTKADLDELPDPVWAYIANKLGLQWSKA